MPIDVCAFSPASVTAAQLTSRPRRPCLLPALVGIIMRELCVAEVVRSSFSFLPLFSSSLFSLPLSLHSCTTDCPSVEEHHNTEQLARRRLPSSPLSLRRQLLLSEERLRRGLPSSPLTPFQRPLFSLPLPCLDHRASQQVRPHQYIPYTPSPPFLLLLLFPELSCNA